MNPTQGDIHVNRPLTNISVAHIQAASRFVASRVFPIIPVMNKSDIYFTYNMGDFNRDSMKDRAPGAESAGADYRMGTDTYLCNVKALHKDIADQLRANQDTPIELDRDATIFVTNQALINREKAFVTGYMTGAAWTTNITGVAANPGAGQVLQWNDGNSNPISDVKTAKRTVAQSTGFEPNKVVLGRAVWDSLSEHPDFIDRVKYGQAGQGSPAMLTLNRAAQLFEVDEVVVMNAIENTAKEGATASHSFIGGKTCLVCYSEPAPGIMKPSAGYIFAWRGFIGSRNGVRIKKFRRAEEYASDRVEIETAYDMKKVSADLGYFFTSIVA